MRKYILPIFTSITIVIVASCFYSCQFSLSGEWKDDHINSSVRDEISKLNKQLMQDVKDDNVAAIKQMMSPILLDSAGTKIDTLINNTSHNVLGSDYKIINEFYTINIAPKATLTLSSDNGGSDDYEIKYKGLNKHMYTSLFIPQTARGNAVVLVCYGKYDSGWKINVLYFGVRKVFNKTAPDYYKLARDEYDKGNLVNAAAMIGVAKQLASPLNDYFRYKNQDEMKDFYDKVITEGDKYYHLPITVNISTHPQIFSVYPQIFDQGEPEGIFPIVRYRSSIPQTDTIALKSEKDNIQKVIGSIFKGITTENDYILYQACDKIPTSASDIIHRYGFVERQK
jgi:hypothetical protein